MVAGAEQGLGMWPFGQHCAFHAFAARNARLEAELGRCLDKIRYMEAMRGCEAEERGRDRAGIASMSAELQEAREKIAWQKRRIRYYEHRNNPSSTRSLRNRQLKFRAGLKVKSGKAGAEAVNAAKVREPRRMGPPEGAPDGVGFRQQSGPSSACRPRSGARRQARAAPPGQCQAQPRWPSAACTGQARVNAGIRAAGA